MIPKFVVISNRAYNNWIVLSDPKRLYKSLKALKPEVVFFPFWSHKVSDDILKEYTCYGFHTGNLPKEAGGSPIQNLIRLGRKKSIVNVFKMTNEIDSGKLIMNKEVSLEGTLDEILLRISKIITEMIDEFQTDYRQQACGQY